MRQPLGILALGLAEDVALGLLSENPSGLQSTPRGRLITLGTTLGHRFTWLPPRLFHRLSHWITEEPCHPYGGNHPWIIKIIAATVSRQHPSPTIVQMTPNFTDTHYDPTPPPSPRHEPLKPFYTLHSTSLATYHPSSSAVMTL